MVGKTDLIVVLFHFVIEHV